MNREKYLEMRAAMLDEAQNLINAGKIEEAATKRKEIEKLDADFEEASKEQANLDALNKENDKVIDMKNLSVSEGGLKAVEKIEKKNPVNYEDVFAKVALQRDLNEDEVNLFNEMNPENVYTHNTTNTEILIPETVIGGIIDTMKELHPILADVVATRIKGTVKYVKRTGIPAGDADYYDEATPTADEENKFGELTLNGKELSKAVTVTWKLQAMAVADFIPFITRELGERMGVAKAKAFVKGKGDAKYPQGVVTAIEAEESTPQKVSYKADGLTYKDITAAMAKIKSGYVSGAKIYANNATVWGSLANLLDGQGRPLFIPDVTTGGVGRIFGIPVMEEDAMGDGEILIGNMAAGYKENISEDMKLVTENHAKARTTDFVGYEVHDGGVIDEKAFAYLVKGV
ncbi:MAG: phage major capsid protein [Peptoniphilus sp.]|uniref:phage major capsid protein n=1 Tax=Peptoniphilus sp. TaxID=1971214 RepID=UPI0025E81DFB|nr:phage major capsid protein [Peptoniphilus sp.]MCI5643934.1 phage major capsid protein [Peptoniphilus sp.]